MSFKRSLVTLCAAMAASMSAQAAFQFELKEVGPDVVLTGSGSFNVDGLKPVMTWANGGSYLVPANSLFQLGPYGPSMEVYPLAVVVGPGSYGSSQGAGPAGSASGNVVTFMFDKYDIVGGADWALAVPIGYTSGTPLSGSATFTGSSFASLGITPGTYTWSWGSGATANSITLTAAVPEPSTYAMALAGLGVLGAWARRQKRISQRPAEAATA